MSIAVVRAAEGWYVQRGAEAFPVKAELPTTAALVTEGLGAVRVVASATARGVPVDGLSLLSPVTTPCRVVGPGGGYRSHARQSGFGEDPPVVFFRKSSGWISGPTDDIVRPARVRLLDYEIELGPVIRRGPVAGTVVGDADLPGHVAGLVMCNDVSARDVQLAKGQFYESKSYPTFTPTGPRLVLLEADDFARLPGLRLRLWVNGELLQQGTAADVIAGPAAALSLLAGFQRLDPVICSSRARRAGPAELSRPRDAGRAVDPAGASVDTEA